MELGTVWQHLHSRAWMWTFGQKTVEGTQIANNGKVRIRLVEWTSETEIDITAHVTDTRLTSYETTVTLQKREQDRITLMSRCQCPGGAYCKHAAALVVHASKPDNQQSIEKLAEESRVKPEPPAPKLTATANGNVRTVSREQHPPSTPHPVLVLRRIDATQMKDARSTKKLRMTVADPMVTYAGCPERLSMMVRAASHEWTRDGVIHRLERDLETERALLRQLYHLGLQQFMEAHPGILTSAPLNHLSVPHSYENEFWPQLRQQHALLLQRDGWAVEASDDFGYDLVAPDEQKWVTNIQADNGEGVQYALEIGVEVNNQRISMIPLLAEAVQKGLTIQEVAESPPGTPFQFLVPELGERLIALSRERLLPILSVLHELASPATKRKKALRLDRLRAAQFSTIQGLALNLPEDLARLGAKLQSVEDYTPVVQPQGLKATLRPYQQEGLTWLQFLREYDLHGILADDMGLGKTLQTISHILAEVESGRGNRPSLILAPTSLLRNWVNEARKFAPSLRTLILHGDNRRERFIYIRQSQLVVTSYPLLIRDIDKLKNYEWHLVVLDEAHTIKNARAKAAQAARSLKARHRLCLTGTPMENHLGELWSLFHFLMPGYLGEQDMFRSFFRNPIEKKQDQHAQDRLSARLKPVMLRRTKDKVAKDLPAKTEILNTVELEKEQSDLYETIRASMNKRVQDAIADQGLEKSQLIVLDALMKLRQVCCHPQLLKLDAAQQIKTSAKLEFLMEDLLPELLEEGRRILIFSQFTSMLAILEAQLKERYVPYLILTGATQDRDALVQKFQTGTIPVFLISLKAGGVGLTLTAADTVIHYDPWWNPAAEAQATDRAHRIGQTKPVFVHKLICQGTIEERILEMQSRKSALVTSLLSGRSEGLKLTSEDVKELLSPL